ncbi:unnamed protein product [Miscanthus lutarioriparius]|uniref:Uncharacterized protein n=1 Tax=Miscanthus lutarioriparius TaxID=422564 RepID=A0A811S3I0_9POAL|nr:unnamed protein product [Miscanthus lutarioriparius]
MATSTEALSASMEKMATQFEGFQTMMKQTLETLSGVGAWQATADEALEHLRQRANAAVTSIGDVSSYILGHASDCASGYSGDASASRTKRARAAAGISTTSAFTSATSTALVRPQPSSRNICNQY